ncbi:MAG: hypothetical protein LBI05_04250 [Planctomycetaceae bacterium]|jgi:hypothetical protein|nr:hypothetical protein [Planctomycetaceae bacterium]
MGIRAYVVTQENKYDGGEYFSNHMADVMGMLDDNGIPFVVGLGKRIGSESRRKDETHWMIDCENGALQEYVAKLETLPPNEPHEYFQECNNPYSNEWVLESLKTWLRHVDPKENAIRIHWH